MANFHVPTVGHVLFEALAKNTWGSQLQSALALTLAAQLGPKENELRSTRTFSVPGTCAAFCSSLRSCSRLALLLSHLVWRSSTSFLRLSDEANTVSEHSAHGSIVLKGEPPMASYFQKLALNRNTPQTPGSFNPRPQALNSKPQALNPKPEILQASNSPSCAFWSASAWTRKDSLVPNALHNKKRTLL